MNTVIYQALVPVKACSSQMTLYDQFLTQASKCRLDRSMNTSEPNLADSEIFDVEKQQVRLILSMVFSSSFSKYFYDFFQKDGRINLALQRKVHQDAEAFIMLEGAVDFLDKPIAVFTRLKHAAGLVTNCVRIFFHLLYPGGKSMN